MHKWAFIICLIILMPYPGKADIIYFKDGMKTVCQEKAWMENQEVKCEYEGTVLIYQKEDVLRIQKIRTTKQPESPPAQTKTTENKKPDAQTAKHPPEIKPPVSQQKPTVVNKSPPPSAAPAGGSDAKGIEFYNPRRPQKYWASASSKHQTFNAAIGALAKQYGRSPEWVKQQMGETNELEEIHRNLSRAKLTVPAETKAVPVKPISETLFYNPRRANKYWSNPTAKHKTYKQAIAALAAQYERPQEWIQQYMGESNNLDEIHQNLKKQKLSETSP